MQTETVCYKIRDSKTGLWSCGGFEPKFTKTGKTWSGRGPLLSHLGHFQPTSWSVRHGKFSGIPNTWEVVTFRIVTDTTEGSVANAREMYEKHKASK